MYVYVCVCGCNILSVLFLMLHPLSVMLLALAVNKRSSVPMGGEVSVLILTGGEGVLWLVEGGVTDHTLSFCGSLRGATVPVVC